MNSLIIAGATVLIALGLGSLCAYALGRLPFRFKGAVLYLVLTMTMFPQIAVLSGLFVMLKGLGLFNTRPGLVLTYLIFTMPFTVWVMTQYFRSLPKELEEAAYVDGASPLTVFWEVLLPLTVPGMISTGLLAFIGAWNEFLFALTFTVTDNMKTVPVVISQFSGTSCLRAAMGIDHGGLDGRYDSFDYFGDVLPESDCGGSHRRSCEGLGYAMKTTVYKPPLAPARR